MTIPAALYIGERDTVFPTPLDPDDGTPEPRGFDFTEWCDALGRLLSGATVTSIKGGLNITGVAVTADQKQVVFTPAPAGARPGQMLPIRCQVTTDAGTEQTVTAILSVRDT